MFYKKHRQPGEISTAQCTALCTAKQSIKSLCLNLVACIGTDGCWPPRKMESVCLTTAFKPQPHLAGCTFAIQSNSDYSTWMSWTDRMFRFRWPRGGEWVTPTWKCFAFSSLFHLHQEQNNLHRALKLPWFLLNPVVMQFLHSFWSTLPHAWLLDRYTLACHS